LAAWKDRDVLHLWEVASGKLKAQWPGHSDWVRSLDFSPDNRVLASASLDHTIALWDVANARLLGRLRGHSAGVYSALFTPDGRWLVSGSDDTNIRIWNVAAALNRPLDYAAFMNWFDLKGRTVTSKALAGGEQRRAGTASPYPQAEMPMKSFTGKSLVAVLQSGLPEEELDRTLFRRFLRAGNLNSARLLLDRHEQSRMAGWKGESETLGRAYLREAKNVLDYEGYCLAAQHAARARTFLPEKTAQAWHLTAMAERGLKRWPEALVAIEQAIASETNSGEFWQCKATILEDQGQKSTAREALMKAIELARQADEKDARLQTWQEHLEQLGR
jgi:tetratricopeptide (TPR) repeat protein